VASLPQSGPNGLRFRFEVEQALLDGRPAVVPQRVSLGWYKGFHEDAVLSQPQAELRAGQRWRFVARLRQPHGHLNPHGFDHELALFEQGVRAVGYVRDTPPQRLADAAGYPVERLRQKLRDALQARVPDARAAGVLAALAVGDQAAIARGYRQSSSTLALPMKPARRAAGVDIWSYAPAVGPAGAFDNKVLLQRCGHGGLARVTTP
jgi:competence protein ComEC